MFIFFNFVRSNFDLPKYHVNCFVRTRIWETSFASISAFSVSSITSMSMLSWSPCIALRTCTQTSVIEPNCWNWILASMSVYRPRHLHIHCYSIFLFSINTSLEVRLCVEDSIKAPYTTGSYGPVQTPVNQSIFFISSLGMFWHLAYFRDLNCSRWKVYHFFILVFVVGEDSWLDMDGLLLLLQTWIIVNL